MMPCLLLGVYRNEATNHLIKPLAIEGNGYETRQISLLYVFVLFSGLDRAQNTIVVYSLLRD